MTDQDMIICRCEGVYMSDIKKAIKNGSSAAPGIKMRIRAGMGHCQGRVCQQTIQHILMIETGKIEKSVIQKSQSPVRPTLLKDF